MYIHRHINAEPYSSITLTTWIQEAKNLGDEGIFVAAEVEGRFSRLQRQQVEANGCHAYLLFDDEEDDTAVAVLDFSHAMGHTDSSWLKLLDINLRPSLLPDSGAFSAEEKADIIATVYGKAIATAITLIFDEHPAKELKIYTRTHYMRGYFKFILSYRALSEKLIKSGLVLLMEGNWFVVRKTD